MFKLGTTFYLFCFPELPNSMTFYVFAAIVVPHHPHPLVEKCNPYAHRNSNGWDCDQCHTSISDPTIASWHCEQCGYDECRACHFGATANVGGVVL